MAWIRVSHGSRTKFRTSLQRELTIVHDRSVTDSSRCATDSSVILASLRYYADSLPRPCPVG